jgi:hypothetical protein
VRFTLLSSDRSRILGRKTVQADARFGDAGTSLNVTPPYGSLTCLGNLRSRSSSASENIREVNGCS